MEQVPMNKFIYYNRGFLLVKIYSLNFFMKYDVEFLFSHVEVEYDLWLDCNCAILKQQGIERKEKNLLKAKIIIIIINIHPMISLATGATLQSIAFHK